ncbi:hypothetical protein D3C87_1419760 [compost metagenome]
MLDACKVLTIKVFQLAMEVAQARVLAEFVVATGVGEIPAFVAGITIGNDRYAIGGIAQLETVQMSRCQGQVIDVGADDLPPLIGLRQQARVVVDQNRRLGQQRAVLERGLGQLDLGRGPGTGKFVRSPAVVMHRKKPGAAAATPGIEPDSQQTQGVGPETHDAGREA